MIKNLFGGLLILALSAVQAGAAERTYTAKLAPNPKMFSADTPARGVAKLKLSADGKKLRYKVQAFGIGAVSQIHLHLGAEITTLEGKHSHLPPERADGPTVVSLLDFVPAGLGSGGTVADGVLTGADLSGPLGNYPLSALVEHLDKGWVYVNVHVFNESIPGQRICCPSGVRGTARRD